MATKTLQPLYRKVLQQQLALRQRANPSFSLRAYAKLLGLQPATLSAVLKGNRSLPGKYGPTIVRKLRLSPLEGQRFLRSLREAHDRHGALVPGEAIEPFVLQEELHHQVISQWEHYAILSLMECPGFVASPAYIGERLGISPLRAEACLQNLRDAGLVAIDPAGKIAKAHADVKTTEDVLSEALRKSHHESLALAGQKLDALPVEARDFSSGVLVMPLAKLPEAKRLIREFRHNFYKLIEDHQGEEVFHLCVQLFPLTQLETQK